MTSALVFCWLGLTAAAPPDTSPPRDNPGAGNASAIDIRTAVEVALDRSPALAARVSAEASADAQVGVARSAYFPRLSFEASYLFYTPRNELPVDLPTDLGLPPVGEVDDFHHVQVGLTVGAQVFDVSRGPREAAAESAREAEVAQTAVDRADLAFAVRAAFLSALYAREVMEVAQASLDVAQREERRVELRAEAGVASDVALAQARVRVANLSAQRRRAETELARYRARLTSLLDRDPLPRLTGRLDALGGGVAVGALDSQPEVHRLQALARASRERAKSRSRALVPTLSVSGTAKLQYPRALQLELGPVIEAMAALSWPIFDGLARENEVDAHDAQAASLSKLAEAKLEALRRDLEDIRARDETAKAELASAEETLKQNRIYLRVAKAALSAGTGTELDVFTAELGLDEARIARTKALFDRALLRAETLRLHGLVTGVDQ